MDSAMLYVAKVEQLLEKKSDPKMFSAIQNPEHCIHTLLPPSKDSDRSLRPRDHNYQLPVVTRKVHHLSFIPRFLFNTYDDSSLILGIDQWRN